MNPILLDVGYFQITWYSIFIMAGVFFGSLLVLWESRRFGIDDDFVMNLLFWAVILGIFGARLYYVAFNWAYYSVNPIEIVKIWEGGLAIHGSIIVGLLFTVLYTKKYDISFFRMADIMSVAIILAQAIGRWGNFFNSEAHGGEVTKEILQKFFIPDFVINGMYIGGVYYHPTFFYESLWCLFGFIILVILRRVYKYLKIGQLTGLYFMWYGLGRFFIEQLRTDSLMFYGFKMAQIISIALFVIGLIIFIIKGRGSKFDNLYSELESEGEKNNGTNTTTESIDNQPVNI